MLASSSFDRTSVPLGILETMADGCQFVDARWRLVYQNPSACRLFAGMGWDPGAMIGRHFWDELFPDARGSEAARLWFRAMDERVPVVFENYHGAWKRWYELQLYPTPDGGVANVFRDLTERKDAQEALQRSEERFRRYFELGLIGMATTSPTKGCIEVNDYMCRMLGYDREELLRKSWAEMTHPDDLAPDVAQFERVLAGEIDGYSLDKRWIRKDGRIVYSTISVKCVRAPGGAVDYFVALAQDIGERRRAERALRESEQRFRTMADTAPMIIWATDAAGRIEFVNQTYRDFFGLREGAAEFDWTRVLHPEDREKYVAAFAEAAKKAAPFHKRTRVMHRDGQWRWVESRGTPRFDPTGRAIGYVGISSDVTEMAESEQTLQRADRRKDEFLATLGHELRNPLAPLRHGLQIMKLARGNAEIVEQARGMMERQVGHMVALVDDLLDLSRVGRGEIVIHKERFDLAIAVSSALDTCEGAIRAARQELKVRLPDTPVHVYGDPVRIAQILSNLLGNASKYTDAGGRIDVSVEVRGTDAEIRVADTGIGIPPEMLTRVFDMFTQVDRSTERGQKGLGIGLTVVKRLVEMHGGTVEARSAGHGAGSEFVVRLPIAVSALEAARRAARGTSAPRARHRVLVVDDSREVALALATMLQLMGNDTRTAYGGIEALDVGEAFRPDVVLMDLGMPNLSGYSAAQMIRETPWGRSARLVAVTGWGQEEDRRASQQAGFDQHLVKPVDPDDLESLLASLG